MAVAGSSEISELGASVDWGTQTPFLEPSQPADGTLVLVAVVIGIILVIVMLFALALLIDCRNQRTAVDDRGGESIARSAVPMAKRVNIPNIPSLFRPKAARDDKIAFVNNMCEENTRPEQIC